MAGMNTSNARQNSKQRDRRKARRLADRTGINKQHNIAKTAARKIADHKRVANMKVPRGLARAIRRVDLGITETQ